MDGELKTLLQMAGKSLEEENSYLEKSVRMNSRYYDGCGRGILRFNNERFYQYIIARYLLRYFPRRLELEKDTHDLVVYGSDVNKYKIVIEMKRWMSGGGVSELPGIKHDSAIKLSDSFSDKAMMMVFSSNPISKALTDDNIMFLTNEIDSVCKVTDVEVYRFITNYKNKGDNDFWVAGFEISKS